MDFEKLKGLIISKIKNEENQELYFYSNDGRVFKQYHSRSCCESVHIEDITGDLNDLIDVPIQMAESYTKQGDNKYSQFTFYKLATIKGYVTIRWLGSSNGYYSVEVQTKEIQPEV